MKVIVFGGSGFLGSHTADVLTDRGHDVTIFDKTKSAYLKKKQKMIVGDILDKNKVNEAMETMDVVYNFAALANMEQASFNPMKTAEVNILGNLNVLEAARKVKIKRFVFSSSVYVYSDSGSFYRTSKQSCELFIENYHKEFGLNYTILRYGSLYGPRADESNWIYKILKEALINKKIVREGDGEEIREYIHVLDAARLSEEILKPNYENRCVIITGNEQMKIKDLLTMIKEVFRNNIEISYLPAKNNLHYEITPYVFKPQLAYKIKSNEHIDMGQGILDILNDLHKELVVKKDLDINNFAETN